MGANTDVREQKRLNEAREAGIPWKKWGPYLSERQWGTVREDYSDNGDAWNYFTHDQARSRAYRWGEDGLGGTLRRQTAALFRPRVVERARPDSERAPVRAHQQRGESRRGRQGVLLLRRQHAHALVHEISLQVPAAGVSLPGLDRHQPEPIAATSSSTSCSIPASSTTTDISTCSWNTRRRALKTSSSASPCTIAGPKRPGFVCCRRSGSAIPGPGARTSRSRRCARWDLASFRPHTSELGEYWLFCDGAPELLFTENESNASRLWDQPNASPYVKDAFHEYIISGRGEAVNPAKTGTKAAAHYVLDVPARGSRTVSLRLAAAGTDDAVGGSKSAMPSAGSTRYSRAGSPTRTNSTIGLRRSR